MNLDLKISTKKKDQNYEFVSIECFTIEITKNWLPSVSIFFFSNSSIIRLDWFVGKKVDEGKTWRENF